jgi:chromosome partitioning protein
MTAFPHPVRHRSDIGMPPARPFPSHSTNSMILTCGNTKGGVGKSTLAVQLALGLSLAGDSVWFVDGDKQGNGIGAMTLRTDRELPTLPASSYTDGKTLRAQVMLQAKQFDHTVIDVGGRDTGALRAALLCSDIVLIPFQPRAFDTWALADVAAVIDEANATRDTPVLALAILNCSDPAGSDNADAIEATQEFPQMELLNLAPGRAGIGRRKAISHASATGLHVSEYKPRDEQAIAEIATLIAVLKDRQNGIVSTSK